MEKEKSITSTTLEDGGKLYPASGYKSNLLPDEGIKITPPKIAKSIANGEAKLFVRTSLPNFEAIDDKRFLLLSMDKALGTIEFGKSFIIEPNDFAKYEEKHLITEEMQKEWGEVQPSWNYGPFVAWEVKSVDKFDEPMKCKYDRSSLEILAKKIWISDQPKEESEANEPEIIEKREIEITNNLNPENLTIDELVDVHFNLHKAYQKSETLSAEEIMNLHSLVVDELYVRNELHPVPPDNGLDQESYDFEIYAEKQNKWFELEKAVWSGAYINTLPDSSFLYVETGGKKDEEGKTVPRSLRHFPYKDASGKIDLPHLRNAIARIPQSKIGLSADEISKLQDKARRLLEEETQKAVWSTAYINTLPDSAFLYVESGGKKDDEGKTVPRTLRHFPYKDATGKIDLPHLRNAIARIPQSKIGLSANQLESLQNKARKILEDENKKKEKIEKKTLAEFLIEAGPPIEWSGAVASVLGKKRCEDLKKLWEALSEEDKKKVEEAFDKMFDAQDVIFDIEDKYGDIAKSLVVIQKDLYASSPKEGQTYKYVVQQHYRGKSVHSDIRMSYDPGKKLIGWTLNTQVPGAVKEPVITLDQAEKLAKNLSKISKIDWNNDQWSKSEILSEKKAQMPWEWINVEGKIEKPEPNEPVPAGATREYPGIIDIVAKGTFEYGAQKQDFHEYFFKGSGLNSRIIFRQLNIKKSELAICSGCGSKDEEKILEIAWSGSNELLHLCENCFVEFLKAQGVFSSVQKAEKRVAWLAIRPEDQTPYSISDRAVSKSWMPQPGYSALPSEIRKQVPEKFQYWNETEGAKEIRDELVKAIKNGEVDIDFSAPYKGSTTLSKANAKFVFQKQAFGDESKSSIRIDVGNDFITVLDLSNNPLDNDVVDTTIWRDKHKDSMDVNGRTSKKHYINKAIASASAVEILDNGKATVVSETDELIEVIFKGNLLNGLYKIDKVEDNWQLSRAGNFNNFNLSIEKHELKKAEDGKELRLVTGIVLEPNEVDAHNDYEKPETIRKTAHKFLSNYNKDTKMGLMHSEFDDIGIELVESYIAPIKLTLNKKNIKKGSWVMTVHVSSDSVWNKVKSGDLTGFSIGGIATVEGR